MQALQGRPLTVYGDGNQTRSLCYVSDLIEGLLRLLLSNDSGPVNIGNPEEVTMLELAREVIEATNSRSRIVHEELPVDDPRRRCPDITKAISLLKWRPQVSRSEGIRRVVPYFKDEVQKFKAPVRSSSRSKKLNNRRDAVLSR
jgi:nucleoside-diphosphate-sugar epimerase